MTVAEAEWVIRKLETEKRMRQRLNSHTQIGGELTQLASNGAGLTAIATGAVMVLFPPTTVAGFMTLVGGLVAVELGQAVAKGVRAIGSVGRMEEIQHIDTWIDSLTMAVRKVG